MDIILRKGRLWYITEMRKACLWVACSRVWWEMRIGVLNRGRVCEKKERDGVCVNNLGKLVQM